MLPSMKSVYMVNGTSATAGATITSLVVDTLGAAFAMIDVLATTQDTTTNNPTVFKIQQADVTAATSFADIVALTGGTATSTSAGFVIGSGYASTTSGYNQYKFNIDLRGKQRYLRLLVSPATTQTVSAVANLYRLEQAAYSASRAGVVSLIEG